MKRFEKIFFLLFPSGAAIDMFLTYLYPEMEIGILTFATMIIATVRINFQKTY